MAAMGVVVAAVAAVAARFMGVIGFQALGAVLVIVVAYGVHHYAQALRAKDPAAVPLNPPDSYDQAYLRAGRLGVVQQAFCGLVAKGAFSLFEGRRPFYLGAFESKSQLEPEEKMLWSYYGSKSGAGFAFPRRLGPEARALESLLIRREQKLAAAGAILDRDQRAALSRAQLVAQTVVLAVAAISIWLLAGQLDSPLGYALLVVVVTIAVVGMVLISKSSQSITTKRGNDLLALGRHQVATQSRPGSSWQGDAGWVAAYGLEVLGRTVLASQAWAIAPPPERVGGGAWGRSRTDSDLDFDGDCGGGDSGCGGGCGS